MAEESQLPPLPPGRGLGLDDDLDAVLASPAEAHESQFRSKRPPSIEIHPPTPREMQTMAPRAMTMSTKRLSYTDIDKARRIKYGEGKYSGVELVPQPSDLPRDPLNWPRWKKALNFWTLLFATGLVNGTKTALIPANAQIAQDFKVSYTAAASLTAIPLVVAAFSGIASTTLARMWGKRPVYLGSMVLLLLGCIWNATAGSYGNCIGARFFQGLGWGAFDVLLFGSIQDTYFEHEHGLRLGIYYTVAAATTWGPPLLGGVATRNAGSFNVQFRIIIAFLAISAVLLAFGAPETAYDRHGGIVGGNRVPPYTPSRPTSQRPVLSIESLKEYASKLCIVDYHGRVSLRTATQAPRALIAPTVAVLSLATFLPHAALWGLFETMALLFTPAPFSQTPAVIGSLLAAPFLMTALSIGGLSFWLARETRRGADNHKTTTTASNGMQTIIIATLSGAFLSATGLFAYSLDIHGVVSSAPSSSSNINIRFALLSFLLGLLASGSAILVTTTRPLVARSAHATCVNTAARARATADMHAAIGFWLSIMSGVFIAAAPDAVDAITGLRDYGVGVGVAHIAVMVGCVMIWRIFEAGIQRWDGVVMGLEDASQVKRSGSFFDWD